MNINKMSKTKIVCTIGPASDDINVLTKMVKSGMNVMRLNFSHGEHETHLEKIKLIEEINSKLNAHVAILLDTKGPEIRTGEFENNSATFKKGQTTTIVMDEVIGTSDLFSITYDRLYRDVKVGGEILVNDGQITLHIESIDDCKIICTCMNDGTVKSGRGINVPNANLRFAYLSKRDISDLEFGCKHKVDYVAASFVRRAQDIYDVKKLLIANDRSDIQVIAKIENAEGVKNIDEIIKAADGIMVARGDLGVEVPAEDVPLIQKQIIQKCNGAGKIVITATQMLESMQENPRATRAEVSDVANAIYDGSDGIMLSGESAVGKYPLEAVMMMSKIARKSEASLDYQSLYQTAVAKTNGATSEAICMSVADIAARFKVGAIIAFTESGATAKKMSRYRPECKVIAATPYPKTARSLALTWGVIPVICKNLDSRAIMIAYATVIAKEHGVQPGQKIVVTGGHPGKIGDTSYLELITV